MDFECILIVICMQQCYLVYSVLSIIIINYSKFIVSVYRSRCTSTCSVTLTLSLAARERTNCALYVTGLHPLARISYSSLHHAHGHILYAGSCQLALHRVHRNH